METDSRDAIELIKEQRGWSHPLNPIIQKIRICLRNDWEVRLEHGCREGNVVADRLASSVLIANIGLEVLEAPPEFVRVLLKNDLDDGGSTRCVFSGC